MFKDKKQYHSLFILACALKFGSNLALSAEGQHDFKRLVLDARKEGQQVKIEGKSSLPKSHFNKDAPCFLELEVSKKTEKLKPSLVQEDKIQFLVSSSLPTPVRFSITAYLCDDKQTFCEKTVTPGTWDGKKLIKTKDHL